MKLDLKVVDWLESRVRYAKDDVQMAEADLEEAEEILMVYRKAGKLIPEMENEYLHYRAGLKDVPRRKRG